MAAMAMSLRVVVPPHPLIAHWLTLLRDSATPSPLFATAMGELGRWLTYEALRDWLPHRSVTIQTPGGSCEGSIVDPSIPLLAVPVLRGGLGLWEGARTVVPSARICHVGIDAPPHGTAHWYLDDLPPTIGARVGVLVWLPQLASGRTLLTLLTRLARAGVQGPGLRVITTVAAAPGLKAVGEAFPDLTLYAACIDPDLSDEGQILPGFGDPSARLYGHAATEIESLPGSLK
jgi:uracil phosphoribosyltransferase